LPYASYGILAQHPNADFLVTTPNPQPVQISAQNELVDGVKIGVVRKQSLPDGDGDGVPDAQEERDGTDSNDFDSFKDRDGDGVPDFIENGQGTNPNNPNSYRDTDGDDVPNYVELRDGTDPLNAASFKDANGDGVADYLQTQPPGGESKIYLPLISQGAAATSAADVSGVETPPALIEAQSTLTLKFYLPAVMR
jgi:hypothetical protein